MFNLSNKLLNSDLNKRDDYSQCSGCGLCALVCPVWTQNTDISLTPWGRAKAIQGGASAHDIKDSIESCVSCGACEPICPEEINVPHMETLLRMDIGIAPVPQELLLGEDRIKFFPTPKLKAQEKWTAKLSVLLKRYAKRSEMITDSPSWQRNLLEQYKSKKVFGLGTWLLKKNLLQDKLKAGDLYWMDTALFHNQYQELVAFYADVSRTTECKLNWNLQRTAMPLGEDNAFFNRKKQFDWVLYNKKVERIVVERIEDWEWMCQHSPLPVVHLLDLLEEAQ